MGIANVLRRSLILDFGVAYYEIHDWLTEKGEATYTQHIYEMHEWCEKNRYKTSWGVGLCGQIPEFMPIKESMGEYPSYNAMLNYVFSSFEYKKFYDSKKMSPTDMTANLIIKPNNYVSVIYDNIESMTQMRKTIINHATKPVTLTLMYGGDDKIVTSIKDFYTSAGEKQYGDFALLAEKKAYEENKPFSLTIQFSNEYSMELLKSTRRMPAYDPLLELCWLSLEQKKGFENCGDYLIFAQTMSQHTAHPGIRLY